MKDTIYLTARQAAQSLGISAATLYAYVSRGLIRSEATGVTRRRRYRAEDVAALKQRRVRGREAVAAAAARTLNFGEPILESAITLIEGGRCYYRGMDSCALAEQATLEDVARLIWQPETDPFAPDNLPPALALDAAAKSRLAKLSPAARCLTVLPLAAAADVKALTMEAPAVARAGARLLRLVAATAGDVPFAARPAHETLARAWRLRDPASQSLLRAALVLSADHELNVSAFTVRCIASAGATIYGATIGGLAALQGRRHGGITERVAAMVEELADSSDLAGAVAKRLERGDFMLGFGHTLYRDGDPRAAWLMQRAAEVCDGPEMRFARRLVDQIREIAGLRPNVDFALVAISRALKLPQGAPLALFMTGRTVGWIGHALEQYAANRLIRPRARYIGVLPHDGATFAPQKAAKKPS
ncbi:MAG TPA: citrate synthase family protein [Candidatus Cybelea sp.]|nr:citrate synthase family protein [Candidatus Cybelea sp.]